MPRTSVARRLVGIVDAERVDVREQVEVLRLQARAWRLLAIVATHDAAYGAIKAKYLLFITVPFVDGDAVRRFIEGHEQMAKEYGRKSGVFVDEPSPTPEQEAK